MVAEILCGAGLTLAALGNYGGPTQTLLPLPGSSAICAGSASLISPTITSDQRGFSNENTSYAGFSATSSCIDAGAVQTNYSAATFNNTSYAGTVNAVGTTPSVIVSLTENGQNVGGVPITLQFTGTGTAAGTSATTVAGVGATFNNLSVNATARTRSPSTFPWSPDDAHRCPETLTINGAGANSTHCGVRSISGLVHLQSFQPDGHAGSYSYAHRRRRAVNTGQVLFTVSGTGGTVGTPLSSAVNGSGQAGVVYTLPGGTTAGTYTITASYTDPGGNSPAATPHNRSRLPAATPTVSVWPTASAITFGQTLASSTLSGGAASVPGTFAFTAPSTAPNGGTQSENVTFSPTDAADYSTVTSTVNVMVTPGQPGNVDGDWRAGNAASLSGNVHSWFSRRQRDRRVDLRGERSVHEHSRWSFDHDELGHGHVLSDCDQGSRHKLQQHNLSCGDSGRDPRPTRRR